MNGCRQGVIMLKFEQKWLEMAFPLPALPVQEAGADIPDYSNNGSDLISALQEILREKQTFQELADKLKDRRDEKNTEEMEQLMRSILPFFDGIEHVLKIARMHPPSEEVNNWLRTIESLYFRATNIFEKNGLRAIESLGKPVDLNFHEVVEYIPSKESRNNTVIAERQKGYIFKDKVIRDAKVVVAYREGSV